MLGRVLGLALVLRGIRYQMDDASHSLGRVPKESFLLKGV